MRAPLLILLAIVALPVLMLFSVWYSTHQRMVALRMQILPGMKLEEVQRFAGKPACVVRRDDPTWAAALSRKFPALDDHTIVYIYQKEGLPYFSVYVLIDERTNAVTRSVVERLGS